jgi:outer membrane protein
MKKMILAATLGLMLFAGSALADSIAGRVGLTARGGVSYVFDSEFTSEAVASGILGGVDKDIEADIGWTGGGGIIYGITNNLSIYFDINYLQTKLKMSGGGGIWKEEFGTGKTLDFALGAQWRFMPSKAFVPYIGAGFDFLWNKIDTTHESPSGWAPDTSFDVDDTFGVHLTAGADYFFTPNIAINAEIRGLLSTKGEMTYKYPGDISFTAAKYNPSNISGFIGIRYFFGNQK